jgi:Eco57I restriction-modification methylase
METAPLKNFATWARTALIREVNARIAGVLAPASSERVEQPKAVAALEKTVAAAGGGDKGRDAVADKVAYTWFNRIIALRFMDANGYTGVGVVSPQAGVALGQPEVLAEAKRGVINTDIVRLSTRAAVAGLLDGTRASGDPQGEAYALLLADYCRYWNRTMPFMFEREGDFTELLIPANLLADDSVLNRSVKVLTEDVCQDVEVIGWLYQFYIAERKQEVFDGFKKNKKAGADEIPAATQLFTPHWIVRYLVENSLGRLWMLNRPSSRLVDYMDYYVEPVDDEADFLKITKPEELKVIDPACGSGHMLTYAFDLLYAIYEEEGYAPSEIPGLVLANNLYGTEIDPRAGALAAFALTMKARGKQRSFFNKQVEPQVCVIEPISFGPDELEVLVTGGGDRNEEVAFWNLFSEADTFGSLIQPNPDLTGRVARHLETLGDGGDLLRANIIERAMRVVTQAEYLLPRYAVLVANPPYMGSGNMGPALAQFAAGNFKLSKSDLFAMFIERGFGLVVPLGHAALVTMEAWMTGSVYSKFRSEVIFKQDLRSLVHMPYLGKGRTAMGINFGITAMVMRHSSDHEARSMFQCIRHFELDTAGVPIEFPVRNDRESVIGLDAFASIPGQPLIYAASSDDLAALASRPKVGDALTTREGLTTGDNDRFMRRWFEVSYTRIAPPASADTERFTAHRWYMYVKGGEFRRWYGNLDFVVDWELDGLRVKSNIDQQTGRVRSHNYNGEYAFMQGLTWSGMSSSKFSARFVPAGYMFDTKGPMGFASDRTDLLAGLAVLNSGSTDRFLGMLAPNLDFKLGHVLNLPFPADDDVRVKLADITGEAISVARSLWDEAETSLDFQGDPLLGGASGLAARVAELDAARQDAASRLADLRARIDETLADASGHGSFSDNQAGDPEVDPIALPERIKNLVAYAVGCMFGRYSLDEPGLVLADQAATLQDYLARVPSPRFTPDVDNVIPIVEGDWFEDDIVERFRQFLRAAFGEQQFEANLRFVTESLGVKSLQDYFVKSFYKDHVQRYKKRPIYWLFSSPKGSFNALIYMHRYTPSTVSTVLNEYLREFQAKLKASLEQAERSNRAKEADVLRAKLVELAQYEHDVLYPLASRQVAIDLDDGVKVNYPKLGTALKKIPGLEATE